MRKRKALPNILQSHDGKIGNFRIAGILSCGLNAIERR